ncbi:Glutamyl-tRNA(Gln) amidotransferase subunit A [Geodia barretti]|uniref:Glutamyl-tRNA(Gln) amidotransferase subunit A n=1 Tax=Geodia barretti TaxID=519541 RepID=A0AA35SA74_GEOBA|nr:Glutamyl-tRNA(Gln) amidotransferase subunit A [Geodia barretti]
MEQADIPFLSATQLASLIEARQVSPEEALHAYLDRIEQVGPKVNAYITVCADEAVQQARQAGQEIQQGRYRGPLHGIPVAVKDQVHTTGILTTDASKIRADFIPTEDATVVAKLKEAGAVIIGKTNMSEFAIGDSFSSFKGPARNPWDLSRDPGTSSTGSGAATAARLCATSLGEDTGGSIRGPASLCGLVGLRPTWGRVSRFGADGACWSIDTIGPISRTVEDCAATIGAIAGYDPKDPYTRQVPVPDYRQALTGDIRGLKVGLVQDYLDPEKSGVDPRVRDAVIAAAGVLSELGADVRDVSLPLSVNCGVAIRTITHVDRVSLHPEWLRERPQDYHHNTRVSFSTANLIPAPVYYKAQKVRAMVRREVLGALEDVDVLIQPTSAAPAGVMSMDGTVASKQQAKQALHRGGYTGPYSLTGTTAMSILCGFSSEGDGGLPLALQIAGRPFDEATVLRVGHAYEQATPWHNRLPPI